MRKYLMGTGIIGAVTSGYALLRGADGQRLTWRVALAWLSWAITLALAIGEIRDIRIASHGGTVSDDSPIAGKEHKYSGAPKQKDARKPGKGAEETRKRAQEATRKAREAQA